MNRGPRPGMGPRFVLDTSRKIDQKKVIKRLWSYLKQNKTGVLIVSVSVFIATAINLASPWIISNAIDKYINVEPINFEFLFIVFLSLIILAVISSVMSYIQQLLMAMVANKTTEKMRSDAFAKLQLLPISYYDKNAHGEIMSTLTNDIEVIMMALIQSVPQLITSIFTLIGSGILMFLMNWQLSLVPIAVLPIMILLTLFIAKKSYKLFRSQQTKIAELNGITEENIGGLKAIKLYNQEEKVISTFKVKNRELRDVGFKAQLFSGFAMPVTNFVNNLAYALIVGVGAYLHINFTKIELVKNVPTSVPLVSIGDINGVTLLSRQFISPINNLAQLFNIISAAIAGADRVFELIDQKSEYLDEAPTVMEKVSGAVEFRDVSFGYEADKPVLKNISFSCQPGQMIAIVGPTGSGKTTIINLLTRYYDATSGDILVDGKSIFDFTKQSLRRHVGVVLQQTYLFSGTVLENIKYGKPDATMDEVIAAAKLAQVHDIIVRLPKGYDSKVKEGGSNFSLGERQLLSIARTILNNPTILVLDEATSSVDTRTEINIQKSMAYLMKGRTSFVIAHRLKTVVRADLILVIRNGQIIERGNHQELMNTPGGLYHDMYNMQFGEGGE